MLKNRGPNKYLWETPKIFLPASYLAIKSSSIPMHDLWNHKLNRMRNNSLSFVKTQPPIFYHVQQCSTTRVSQG